MDGKFSRMSRPALSKRNDGSFSTILAWATTSDEFSLILYRGVFSGFSNFLFVTLGYSWWRYRQFTNSFCVQQSCLTPLLARRPFDVQAWAIYIVWLQCRKLALGYQGVSLLMLRFSFYLIHRLLAARDVLLYITKLINAYLYLYVCYRSVFAVHWRNLVTQHERPHPTLSTTQAPLHYPQHQE